MAFYDFYPQIKVFKKFRTRLVTNFGADFTSMLFVVYFYLKGLVSSAVFLSLLPFFKHTLKVNETTYQIYIIVAAIPWSIKPFVGSISDLYPLFGYHKKGYMTIATILGCVALLVLGLFPFGPSTAIVAPFLIFFVSAMVAVVDLFCEAHYSLKIRENSKIEGKESESKEVVSFVWGCVTTGYLAASTFVGVFTDHFNPQYLYLICAPFAVYTLIPIGRNYLGEVRVLQENKKIQLEKFKEHWRLFVLAFAMAFFAMGMAVVNLVAGQHFVLIYSISVSVILCILSLLFQERTKAKCNVYLFLIEATYIQIPGAMDYWYTADASCVAGGPHFDMTYYLTYTSVVGSLASILGIVLFQTKMSKWGFRQAFIMSSVIRIFSSFFDIIIVKRLNLKVGIPDKVAYMFGDALILNTASMLASMPAVVLTASIVNEGLESTTYALLAGFQNFGSNVSKSIGAALMAFMGIDADSRPCKFDNLPFLIFLCHSVFPLIPFFLLCFLIENKVAGENKLKQPVSNDQKEDYVLVSTDSEAFMDK